MRHQRVDRSAAGKRCRPASGTACLHHFPPVALVALLRGLARAGGSLNRVRCGCCCCWPASFLLLRAQILRCRGPAIPTVIIPLVLTFFALYLHNIHYDAHGPREIRRSASWPPECWPGWCTLCNLIWHFLPSSPFPPFFRRGQWKARAPALFHGLRSMGHGCRPTPRQALTNQLSSETSLPSPFYSLPPRRCALHSHIMYRL